MPRPIGVNSAVDPRQHRRNHESWTKTRWRSVCTADHSSFTLSCSMPGDAPQPLDGRRPVGAQLPPALAQVGQVVGADQPAHRVTTVELGLDVLHDLDAVDDEVESPARRSRRPACTTPIKRVSFRSHSRNSAPSRSSSTNRSMRAQPRARRRHGDRMAWMRFLSIQSLGRVRPRRQLRGHLPAAATRPRGVARAHGGLLQPHRVRRVARSAAPARRRARRGHRHRGARRARARATRCSPATRAAPGICEVIVDAVARVKAANPAATYTCDPVMGNAKSAASSTPRSRRSCASRWCRPPT